MGVASGSGWNLWVWLVGGMYGCGYQEVGVVGRGRVWLAGGIYGCGYQEVGVASGWNVCTCICSFLQQHPYIFFHLVKMIFRSCLFYFCAIL